MPLIFSTISLAWYFRQFYCVWSTVKTELGSNIGVGNEGRLGISLTIFQTSPAMFSLSNLTSTAFFSAFNIFNHEKYWSIQCVKSACEYDCWSSFVICSSFLQNCSFLMRKLCYSNREKKSKFLVFSLEFQRFFPITRTIHSNRMVFQLVPGGFSDLMHWKNYN